MKAKVNNLIARYEADVAALKKQPFYSDMRHTQIAMMERFINDLKSLTK